jgi:hypothetical protein
MANNDNDTWSCESCTFLNINKDFLCCEVCQAARINDNDYDNEAFEQSVHSTDDSNNKRKQLVVSNHVNVDTNGLINYKKQKFSNVNAIDLTISNYNIKDEVRCINLFSLNIIGTQDNLMTKILNSVKDIEHLKEINEIIQKCYQNDENNIDDVNKLAGKLKSVLNNNIKNILSFSLYWPAFLAALNSPNDSRRRATLEEVCKGHWSWWIRTAGDRYSEASNNHWKTIKKTMTEKGIVIRKLEDEQDHFEVLNFDGVIKCIYDPLTQKLMWYII